MKRMMIAAPSATTPPFCASTFHKLLALRKSGATGALEVLVEGAQTVVHIRRGVPVFAEGGETLGRKLLRERTLTLKQYVRVTDELSKRASGSDKDEDFGEIAVRLGFLTLDDARGILSGLVCERIVRCLQSKEQEWHFIPKDERVSPRGDYSVPLERLFLMAARLCEPRRAELLLELDEDRYPRLLADFETIAQSFSMSTAEARFLKDIDGARSTHSLLGASLADGSDASAVLAALMLSGLVELLPHPTSVRNSAVVARVAPPAREVASRRSASSSSSASSPRSSKRVSMAPRARRKTSRAPRSSVAAQIGADALLRGLRPHPVPLFANPAADPDPLATASAAFERGKEHIRRFAFRPALAELRRAASFFKKDPTCATYLKWAELRMKGESLPKRNELKKLACKATAHDRKFAFGYYVLGHLALMDGESDAAKRLFHHAWALEVDTTDARCPPISRCQER